MKGIKMVIKNSYHKIVIATPIEVELINIPASKFIMGIEKPEFETEFPHLEDPRHEVNVDSFFMSKYPITNEQFFAFVNDTDHKTSDWQEYKFPESKKNHPATNVDWFDAKDFCKWLSDETKMNIYLPSEAEWEKCARGTDGRMFPWGNEWDIDKLCCFHNSNGTSEVGTYSPAGDSPYGLADMAGNVMEWTNSLCWKYPYNPDDGREKYTSKDVFLIERVMRGGSFVDQVIFNYRTGARFDQGPSARFPNYGFRIALKT